MRDINHYKIIDIHNHIYPDKIAAKAVKSIGAFYENSPMKGKGTLKDLLNSGKKADIGYYVVSSAATEPKQVSEINSYMASLSAYPNLIRFGTIHPEIYNPDKEIKKIKSLGLQGIKLHPDFQRFNIDDPAMIPIYKALEGSLPVLFHIGDHRMDHSSPVRLARITDMFPGLTIIAAHLGSYMVWEKQWSTLIGKKIYIDTSSALMYMQPEQAVKIIRTHGVDKTLYGTDYPMWSHSEEVKRFLSLGLNSFEKRCILSLNASKLFGINIAQEATSSFDQ